MIQGAHISLPSKQEKILKEWLESREQDILMNIEDFGDLKYLFTVVMDRSPGVKW